MASIIQFHNKALIIVGAALTTIGIYYPWAEVNPDLPNGAKVPTYELSGLDTGLSVFDTGLIIILLAVIFGYLFLGKKMYSTVTLLSGVLLSSVAAFFIAGESYGFDAVFTPTVGWYATVLGGALWILSGGANLSYEMID